jgi:dipeptidase
VCDTFVVLPQASADGAAIVGKNSDREPGEAHELVVVPAAAHPAGSAVECTYIQIPQVRRTNRVLLAKPYWMWGAEMGVNEHGVVIGNEALFTKSIDKGSRALLGMDLLRLGLERADDAEEAVDVIAPDALPQQLHRGRPPPGLGAGDRRPRMGGAGGA